MNISFEAKVALVTGAASGLGLATAKAFAESGASVALADWNEDAVRAAAADGHRVFIEVSPHPVISGGVADILDDVGGDRAVLNTLRKDDGGPDRSSGWDLV